jgi:formate dehydrogenase beta subunit
VGVERQRGHGAQGSDFWGAHDPVHLSYLESNVPCRAACPVGTNAGGYVSLIARGHFKEAYLLARRPNPFASVCGRICAHPCEAACRRGAIDAPLNIRALKRVITERFGVESHATLDEIAAIVEKPRPRAERPGKVAIVGAGPAGLACAHDLALMGHAAVVFDGAPVAGGMMRLGIPEYRLPRELIECEVDLIRHLGVELRLGVEIGRDVSFASLRAEYDAVFLAPGCRRGRMASMPGSELGGVVTAVDFLAAVNLGTPIDVGARVVVVGGGNVAFDVARSARRFGGTTEPDEEHHNLLVDAAMVAARTLGRNVTLVSLEAEHELPADLRELEEATEEGIRFHHRRGPKAVLGDEGRVRALEVLDVARVFDANGRFAPELVPGTETQIPCDTVIFAIGQVADLGFLGADHGLELTPRNTIKVDRGTCATTDPRIFAGGDVAFGPRIVIEAVADGRRAALAIDTTLTGRRSAPVQHRLRVFDTHGYDHPFARGDYERIERATLPLIDVGVRSQRAEVELALTEDAARIEAARCLHCWVNTIFDSHALAGTECLQCGGCSDVCPEQCIDLVSLARVAPGDDPGTLRLPSGAPLALVHGGQGAALVKDESTCIRCGLCARRCPAQVITMQAIYRADEVDLMALADARI